MTLAHSNYPKTLKTINLKQNNILTLTKKKKQV
jgi:hypothetical protein